MNTRKSVWLITLLACVGLGLLAGWMVWGGKEVEAKDPIYYVLHPNGEIYPTPQKGERIRWIDTKGKPVYVHFVSGSPCKDTATVTVTWDCLIDKDATGAYAYICSDIPGNPPCKDPGIDPNSDLGPGLRKYPAAPSPPVTPRVGVTNSVPDLNFSFTCDRKTKTITGINLADTGNPFAPGQTYSAKLVKSMSFEANQFVPAISITAKNQGDPTLCNIPTGATGSCTAGGDASGKVYEMEVKDSAANGACKSSGSVNVEITVQ